MRYERADFDFEHPQYGAQGTRATCIHCGMTAWCPEEYGRVISAHEKALVMVPHTPSCALVKASTEATQ